MHKDLFVYVKFLLQHQSMRKFNVFILLEMTRISHILIILNLSTVYKILDIQRVVSTAVIQYLKVIKPKFCTLQQCLNTFRATGLYKYIRLPRHPCFVYNFSLSFEYYRYKWFKTILSFHNFENKRVDKYFSDIQYI